MSTSRSLSPWFLAAGLALLAPGCASKDVVNEGFVAAEQRDGVWVFSFAEEPMMSNHALFGGRAAVVDGCLRIGDAVVVWREDQLPAVDDILARLAAGELLDVQVGGGGDALSEGATLDDFPAEVNDNCPADVVWSAGDSEVTVTTGV